MLNKSFFLNFSIYPRLFNCANNFSSVANQCFINFISLKYMAPVGGEDMDKIQGDVTLTFAESNESAVLLLGDKESRLDTLRRIFNIDKYKRIQENCTLFLKHLRSEARIYEERLEEYEDKITEKENLHLKRIYLWRITKRAELFS